MKINASIHVHLQPVQRYAAEMKALGKDHVVITVPPGTAAANMGYRFTTCLREELAEYVAGGSKEVRS